MLVTLPTLADYPIVHVNMEIRKVDAVYKVGSCWATGKLSITVTENTACPRKKSNE